VPKRAEKAGKSSGQAALDPTDAGAGLLLIETLHRILYASGPGNPPLDRELPKLERRHGGAVYSELIHILSHLRFDPDEARHHWERIKDHRASMAKRLGEPVDLRVALVSYFVEVNQKLKNPKIIELKLFEQTQASAYRDELTGLCNYRYFREYLEREVDRSTRFNAPLSLVMLDIDHFKFYNDRNGHEAGNRALTAIAALLTRSLRRIDVAARYGGEEFALILPSTSKTGAHMVAERARLLAEQESFPGETAQPGGRLTVSLGVATLPADASGVDDLVQHADAALYLAKEQGRNRVHIYGENRRSFGRVDATLQGRFSTVSPDLRPLDLVNLSEGGMLFMTADRLPVGALLDFALVLPGDEREIRASGRIVRVEPREGRFETAIRLIDIEPADRVRLTLFIRRQGPPAPQDDVRKAG
jgi:diguanylate cyclase (GGDEF)-like protein